MKRFVQTLCWSLALLAGVTAYAQSGTYPSQLVRWIVPYAAGGDTDTVARALADAMQPSLGRALPYLCKKLGK